MNNLQVGTASPNPNYPQDIKNTGDDGSVNEKVQNKNYLPTDNINKVQAGVTILSQNGGSLLFNGTKRGAGNFDFNNNVFELEAGNYTLCSRKKSGSATGTVYHKLFNMDKNTEEFSKEVYQPYIFTNWGSYGLLNFTVTEKSKYYFRMVIPDGVVYTDFDLETIICKGTLSADTIGDFIKHEAPQNISFPLAQGQKLMQGDYLADDGVHHVTKQVKLTGDENWYYDNNCFVTTTYSDVKKTDTSGKIIVLCSHFQGDVTNYRGGIADGCIAKVIGSNIQIAIRASEFNQVVADFKTFLQNNNVLIQYYTETETIEPYTSEQQTVYNEIKKLRTYKPVTHISSEDEVPATVNITYVRDLETVINNLSN